MINKTIYLACFLGLCISMSAPGVSAATATTTQMTYQGLLKQARHEVDTRHYYAALFDYRKLLAMDPSNTDLLIEAGRVYSWNDQHDQAIDCYNNVILIDPVRRDDVLAALAMQYLWNNQPREAVFLFQDYLKRHPDDVDAQVGLARAQYWSGVDEQGLATVQKIIKPTPEAVSLRNTIKDGLSSNFYFNYEHSEDSDDLITNGYSFSSTYHFGTAATVTPYYRYVDVEQTGTAIHGSTFMIGLGDRYGALDSGYGLIYPKISLGGRNYSGWETPAWEGDVKWIPSDPWRVFFNAQNELIENIQALQNRVVYSSTSLGFDYHFTPEMMVAVGGGVGRFDDGNVRVQGVNRWLYSPDITPGFSFGVEGLAFHDADPQIDRGYYNPNNYEQGLLITEIKKNYFGLMWRLRAGYGRLSEGQGGVSGNLFVYRASIGKEISRFGSAEAYIGESGPSNASAQNTNTYRRKYMGLTLIKLL